MFLVTQCYYRGDILLVKVGQKKKRCPYCNASLSVFKMRVLAKAKSSSEATRIAIHIKDIRKKQ